jgi:hypothetical protein
VTNPENPRPPPRFRWSATQRLRGRRAVAREDVRRSSSVVVPFRWTLGCSPRSDAGAPVVPLSLVVSMVVEGHHGNRGLLPSSTSVSLRRRPSCTPPRRVPRPDPATERRRPCLCLFRTASARARRPFPHLGPPTLLDADRPGQFDGSWVSVAAGEVSIVCGVTPAGRLRVVLVLNLLLVGGLVAVGLSAHFPWGACGPVRMLTGLVISPSRPRG